MTSRLGLLTSLFLVSASLGCVSIDAPPSFLVIDDRGHHTKMITADEAKFRIQELDDDNRGSFDFWSKALRSNFVDKRGYTLLESNDVRDANGQPGLELLFEATTQGYTHRYLVTLFVIESSSLSNKIRVAEYVATKDKFDAYLGEVRESIAKLRS